MMENTTQSNLDVVRDITLQDLENRYPDTSRDVETVVFEIPPNPPAGGGGGGHKHRLLDMCAAFTVSVLAGIAVYWIVFYWPEAVPTANPSVVQINAPTVKQAEAANAP